MTDQELFDFYQKWKGKEVEFSDKEDFSYFEKEKLAIVKLGFAKFPFVSVMRASFKYARAIKRAPVLGDKVKYFDTNDGYHTQGFYITNVGGKYPHLVCPNNNHFKKFKSGKTFIAATYKHAEVVD